MKFEDFLDKYAWHGDARYKLIPANRSRVSININSKFSYVIRDSYTRTEIRQLEEIPEIARKLVKEMNQEEFAHLKRIYDICFVKYKK